MSFHTAVIRSKSDSYMNEVKNIASNGSCQPLRIFLVEDSIEVRDLIIENLTMIKGVEVVGVAESEVDALNQLNETPCDILIVDIQLKKGNGINLLRHLSEKRDYDPLKIICSNNATEVFRRVGRQYGVNHFYDKTAEFPQLFELVKELSHARIECGSRP